VFSDPVGAKLCVFSDAQARGYTVVLIFIGISGPERSDERVEQGQVTMEAEVLPPWWRKITGSGRSRPRAFDRCRRGRAGCAGDRRHRPSTAPAAARRLVWQARHGNGCTASVSV
jgi:hypothetical protein